MLWSGRQRFKRERQTALCGSQRERNTPNGFLRLTGYLLWQWQRQGREKNRSWFTFPFPFIFSCWALQKTSVNNVCHKKTFEVSEKSNTRKCPICCMHGKLQLFHRFSAWTFVAMILGDSSFFFSLLHLHTQQFLHSSRRNSRIPILFLLLFSLFYIYVFRGLGQSINKCQASNVFLLCQPQ